MKKVLTFMVLLASLLFVQQANAQVKFGLKGGLNVTICLSAKMYSMLLIRPVSL